MKTRLLIPLFCALLVAACTSDAGSPEDVVESYLKASMEHDVDTMRKLLVKEEAEMLQDLPDDWDERGPRTRVSFEIGKARIEGDRATVPVKHQAGDGDPIETDYTCIKQDGYWKLTLRGSRQAMESETSP